MTDEEAQKIAAYWFVHGGAPESARANAKSMCQRYGGCSEVILAAYAESAMKDGVTLENLPRNLHVPQAVLDLLTAQDRMGEQWAEADDLSRRSMWATLHYRADQVRAHYGLPTMGLPKPAHDF